MFQEAPEQLERRLSELQSQIDRLSMSLHLWREKQDHLQPMESRLSELTDQCAEIVDRWAATGERHAQAVGELEEQLHGWNAAEARVQRNASERMQELQRTIEQEWSALRRLHEEPVKQLREQAATLTEVSVAAATSAISGFDRAEARLTDLEGNLDRRLTELSQQVQAAVEELRAPAARHAQALPSPAPATTWPLEGVVRLHNQLRDSGETGDALELSLPANGPRRLPEAVTPLSARLETLEQALSDGQAEIRQVAARSSRAGRLWWSALILIAIVIVGTAIIVARLQQQVGVDAARVTKAEQQAQAATQAANQQIAAARDDAAHQIAEATATALKAQVIGNVLSAPDLVRYNLVGKDRTALSSAQALWSRSRGFVFSGSRLPPPGPDLTYQIWILTNGEPVSAGLFVPDAAGRFTLATDSLPQIPRPITGISVTVESAGGRGLPTGAPVLFRAPQP